MKFLKSKLFIIILSSFLVFNTCAAAFISLSLPENVNLTQGSDNTDWLPQGIDWIADVKNTHVTPALQNSSETVKQKSEEYISQVCLYGFIPIKTVKVSVSDILYVIPGGDSIGINLKTEGLLVVGIADFDSGGKKISPAEDAGIRTGDIITEVNGHKVKRINALTEAVNSADKVILSGYRSGEKFTWNVAPAVCDQTNKLKLGLWVRESVAGIGTVTFYTDTHFAALGHPISDIDTGASVIPDGGSICMSEIIGVDKGEKGKPGSLKGIFRGDECGEICLNTYCGVFGTMSKRPSAEKIPVGTKDEVTCGDAFIRCDIGDGAKEYGINILRVGTDKAKSMIIKITDQNLIEKTGGIVQGMSGSPIIQNGKLIGAVTHVFVNDPTRGYGIFIENMLAEAKKIK